MAQHRLSVEAFVLNAAPRKVRAPEGLNNKRQLARLFLYNNFTYAVR
jgi:hypothetical protein